MKEILNQLKKIDKTSKKVELLKKMIEEGDGEKDKVLSLMIANLDPSLIKDKIKENKILDDFANNIKKANQEELVIDFNEDLEFYKIFKDEKLLATGKLNFNIKYFKHKDIYLYMYFLMNTKKHAYFNILSQYYKG